MAIAYYGTDLSPNQTETVEGYLICRNVPIARTGRQEYLARELMLDGDPERVVVVDRLPEDVFETAALASFEGKPVTDGHPPENVGPENFAAYARGHIQNVRRSGDYIVADLYINDAGLASEVRNGVKREVSCGYLCNYEPAGTGYKQSHIRGNHVAVVPRGRAGHDVAIQDAASKAEKGRTNMSKFTHAILTALGMAAKDAGSDEEFNDLVTTAATALDAAPAEPEKPAPEAEPAEDVMVEKAPKGDDIGSKLDRIITMLEAQSRGGRGERPLHDESDLDEMVARLAGKKEDPEAAVTVPAEEMEDGCTSPAAKDAAVALLKKVRPAVAAIQDKQARSRVVDALLSTIKSPNTVGDIMQAAQDSAWKSSEASRRTNYQKMCEDAENAYAARNPHKKKEV